MTWTGSDDAAICDICERMWPDGLISPWHNDIDAAQAKTARPRQTEFLICAGCLRELIIAAVLGAPLPRVASRDDAAAAIRASQAVWSMAMASECAIEEALGEAVEQIGQDRAA